MRRGRFSLIISLRKLKPLLAIPLTASYRASAPKWLHNLRNAGIFFLLLLSFLFSSPIISLFCFMYIYVYSFLPIIIPSAAPVLSSLPASYDTIS